MENTQDEGGGRKTDPKAELLHQSQLTSSGRARAPPPAPPAGVVFETMRIADQGLCYLRSPYTSLPYLTSAFRPEERAGLQLKLLRALWTQPGAFFLCLTDVGVPGCSDSGYEGPLSFLLPGWRPESDPPSLKLALPTAAVWL